MNFICRSGYVCTGAFLLVSLVLALTSSSAKNPNSVSVSDAQGTPAQAEKFIADAEKRLLDLNVKYSRADWVKSTFITDDTEALSADANEEVIKATTELADQSRRFDGLHLAPDVERKINFIVPCVAKLDSTDPCISVRSTAIRRLVRS